MDENATCTFPGGLQRQSVGGSIGGEFFLRISTHNVLVRAPQSDLHMVNSCAQQAVFTAE